MQLFFDVNEVVLVFDFENNRIGARRKIPRRALARCVADLGGLKPSRKITTNDDVVGQMRKSRRSRRGKGRGWIGAPARVWMGLIAARANINAVVDRSSCCQS